LNVAYFFKEDIHLLIGQYGTFVAHERAELFDKQDRGERQSGAVL
jgi:hypothetical protein